MFTLPLQQVINPGDCVSVHIIVTADQGMRAHITLTANQDIPVDLSEGSHYRYSMSSTLASSIGQATAD